MRVEQCRDCGAVAGHGGPAETLTGGLCSKCRAWRAEHNGEPMCPEEQRRLKWAQFPQYRSERDGEASVA